MENAALMHHEGSKGKEQGRIYQDEKLFRAQRDNALIQC